MVDYEVTDYEKGIDYGIAMMADWMLYMADLPADAYKHQALRFARNMKNKHAEGSE